MLGRRDGFPDIHQGLTLGRWYAVAMSSAHGIFRGKRTEILHPLEVMEGMTENPSRDGEEVIGFLGNGDDKPGAR